MGGVKNQVMILFKTTGYSQPKLVKTAKTVYGGRKKKSEEDVIKSIRNLFKLKKENEEIEHRITTDIRTLFEQEKEIIINQYEQAIFGIRIILHMKVVVIEIKPHQQKGTQMKLNHT